LRKRGKAEFGSTARRFAAINSLETIETNGGTDPENVR
jgi:hypothetical protein